MEVRDIFAAVTAHAIISNIKTEADYRRLKQHATEDGLAVSQWIARDSYKQADALMSRKMGKK